MWDERPRSNIFLRDYAAAVRFFAEDLFETNSQCH
jgi:hypothetical protein